MFEYDGIPQTATCAVCGKEDELIQKGNTGYCFDCLVKVERQTTGLFVIGNDNTLPERFTDAVLAAHAVKLFKGMAVYWNAGKWLLWTGNRWCSDIPAGVHPLVTRYIQSLLVEIARAKGLEPEARSKMLKAACLYENYKKSLSLIDAMSVIPAAIVESHQLDSDPMLFNCLNGTIDHRTGELLTHSPDHNITRICNVEYIPTANCHTFIKFLDCIFDHDAELIGYIKRLIGYCLTGRTDEQVMAFFYGTGRNGKTTLIKVMLMLLADFACSAQADILMQRKQDGANNELARLRGARLVAVNEVEEGAKLAEAQLKTMTGGDTVTARFLYHEFFEYVPQFKLILVGNHKPQIRGRDLGIWRRIHLVPFAVTISEEETDPHLLEKLKAELPGILAWAVQGCLEWQRTGLKPPATVLSATDHYRRGEDIFDQWLDECCVVDRGSKASSQELLESFKEFSGLRHITSTKLGKMLEEADFDRHSDGSKRHWLGIGLLAESHLQV